MRKDTRTSTEMKKIVNNWHWISAFLAGAVALAAMMFLFAEVLMHWVMFPIRLKTFYNAGMATAVSAVFLMQVCSSGTTIFSPSYGSSSTFFSSLLIFVTC